MRLGFCPILTEQVGEDRASVFYSCHAPRSNHLACHWGGCGETDAFQSINCSTPRSIAPMSIPTICARPVIGVDVLPQKRDFAHAAFDQIARLLQHALCRARHLCAAGIGYNAECAEFITAFLHSQKRGEARFALGGVSGVRIYPLLENPYQSRGCLCLCL